MVMRKNIRSTCHGACALEYRSAVEILLECLFGWDIKRKEGRKGILGKLIAYTVGHEEQARKTLHGHWNIWVDGFEEIRNSLFS